MVEIRNLPSLIPSCQLHSQAIDRKVNTVPDHPERQVPPPPSGGGATPIPDFPEQSGAPSHRAQPTRPGGSRPAVPAPAPPASTPPAPAKPSRRQPLSAAAPVPAPPGESPTVRPEKASPTPALGRSPGRSATERRERLERLAANRGTGAPAATPASTRRRREAPVLTDRAQREASSQEMARPPAPWSRRATTSRPVPPVVPATEEPSRLRRVTPPGPSTQPASESVVPAPPLRRQTPQAPSRIPEPPARGTQPSTTRRRPPSRILEALDEQLAQAQAVEATEKTKARRADVSLRRVRPGLASSTSPGGARTPAIASRIPITPVPPTRTRHDAGAGSAELGHLPGPSVPPAAGMPLVPPVQTSKGPVLDVPPHPGHALASDDPLAASYQRLVKAAKRQAALQRAQQPQPDAEPSEQPDHGGTPPGDTNADPAEVGTPPHDPGGLAVHADLDEARKDADLLFGPEADQSRPSDLVIPVLVPAPSQEGTDSEGVARVPETPQESDTVDVDGQAPVLQMDEPSAVPDDGDEDPVAPLDAQHADDDHGDTALGHEDDQIEDAYIVAEPGDGPGGTIIATDLDLITSPEAITPVDPDTVTVDEDALDQDVVESDVTAALASAPARVTPQASSPQAEVPPVRTDADPQPQNRGFRVLISVLILVIFALVAIATYRMMTQRGALPAESTPTPIVPTDPGATDSAPVPSRTPVPSTATPVPALPPREPLKSDAAIPPALPGQSVMPEVNGGAGSVEIGNHTIPINHINEVNLPGLIDNPVAGEDAQVQSILSEGAHVWLGSDQDNRVLAVVPESFRGVIKDLQAGDRIDFIGTLVEADVPEILAPEQGRDRLIRQGAAIEITNLTVRS